jgi:hypothetical protein
MVEVYLHFAILLHGVLIKKRDSFTFDLCNYELTPLPPSTYTLKRFNESRYEHFSFYMLLLLLVW